MAKMDPPTAGTSGTFCKVLDMVWFFFFTMDEIFLWNGKVR